FKYLNINSFPTRRSSDLTPFELIHHENPDHDRKQILSILAQFGITFDMANRPLNTLSGGEKTKVKFALTRTHKSNVLILDEPTKDRKSTRLNSSHVKISY